VPLSFRLSSLGSRSSLSFKSVVERTMHLSKFNNGPTPVSSILTPRLARFTGSSCILLSECSSGCVRWIRFLETSLCHSYSLTWARHQEIRAI
jgi:hypothetical protein